MLGFQLGFWDYLTFAALAIMAIAAVVVIVWLLIAVVALSVAAARWRELARAFEPTEDNKP